MRGPDADAVKNLDLFAAMPETQFDLMMQASFLQRFPPHVVLIDEGDIPDFLHVVLEGAVDLFTQHDEMESTVMVVRPVRAFILAAVMSDQPYLKSARTLENSRILMIPVKSVQAAFEASPEFARAVVRELAGAYRTMTRELKNQKLRTSLERLANWIIRTHARMGGTDSFNLPYDKRTLASRLGMTPENLSRTFSQLAQHGVAIRGRTIEVRDLNTLINLAHPNPLIDDI